MIDFHKSALSVSAVAFFISDLVKNQLGLMLIKGEISNLQLRKGSAYFRFSLKDDKAKIDCLTHQTTKAAQVLRHVQDGDEVLILAQPSFYAKNSQISFFTEHMMSLGEGILRSKLQKLKHRLHQEGIFDQKHKKNLPPYPEHIGIVTSRDGAALQDILRIIRDRYPMVQVSIFPSLVQGEDAPSMLLQALKTALTYPLDAIIIGRGGGSGEDLEAFNNEDLVRCIFNASVPIISAVGHEIDTTLVDYVADASAPTPTGAAMMLLPDKNEILKELDICRKILHNRYNDRIREETISLDYLKEKLNSSLQQFYQYQSQELKQYKALLDQYNPDAILKKGYAVLKFADGKKLNTIKTGDSLTIVTETYEMQATINNIKENKNAQ